jgi:hypothetical protein
MGSAWPAHLPGPPMAVDSRAKTSRHRQNWGVRQIPVQDRCGNPVGKLEVKPLDEKPTFQSESGENVGSSLCLTRENESNDGKRGASLRPQIQSRLVFANGRSAALLAILAEDYRETLQNSCH